MWRWQGGGYPRMVGGGLGLFDAAVGSEMTRGLRDSDDGCTDFSWRRQRRCKGNNGNIKVEAAARRNQQRCRLHLDAAGQ